MKPKTYARVVQVLRAHGFIFVRSSGSHRSALARRSLLPKRQRSVRGLLTRPSSSGVDASAKAALAARQMRRGSWSRVSACGFSRVKHVERVEGWETTGTTCKNNFYAAQQARQFESAARFRGEAHKEQIFWYNCVAQVR